METFIKQDAINKAVLFQLFRLAQSSDTTFSSDELTKRFDMQLGAKRIKLAFEHLDDDEFVSYFLQNGRASINRKGYKYIEDELLKEDSFVSLYAEHGDKWLANQTLERGGIPASDRVVSRHDNQAEVEEISTGIGELVEELQQDNEVGAALGDDRDLIIAEASASQELLKAERFRAARLARLLVPALKFLGEKFSGAAIGELAKRLIALIEALF